MVKNSDYVLAVAAGHSPAEDAEIKFDAQGTVTAGGVVMVISTRLLPILINTNVNLSSIELSGDTRHIVFDELLTGGTNPYEALKTQNNGNDFFIGSIFIGYSVTFGANTADTHRFYLTASDFKD